MKTKILNIIFILTSVICFAQSTNPDLLNFERYWYYRYRLRYFVYPSEDQGGSMVASIRNIYKQKTLNFGQEGEFLGLYIGILATEYKILSDNLQTTSANQTKAELLLALKAIKRKDLNCEGNFPWEDYGPPTFNGYSLFDDVPADFLINHDMNFGLTSDSTWNYFYYVKGEPGHPGYVNEISSGYSNMVTSTESEARKYNQVDQDDIITLFLGLALVSRCLEYNSPEASLAREITSKIINHLKSPDSNPLHAWRIVTPDGNILDAFGNNAWAYQYGLAAAANYILGYEAYEPHNQLTFLSAIDGLELIDKQDRDNRAMVAILIAISDCATLNGTCPDLKALTSNQYFTWSPFYLLLWNFLHYDNIQIPGGDISLAHNMLTTAPCSGPYFYKNVGSAQGGWASTNRFWNTDFIAYFGENSNSIQGAYSGLDYMLLYNLYYLVVSPIPFYFNTIKIYDNAYYPHKFCNDSYITGDNSNPAYVQAFESIETGAKILTNCHIYGFNCMESPFADIGNVTMRAQEKIHLKSGFRAQHGTYFRASIFHYSCNTGSNKSLYSDESFCRKKVLEQKNNNIYANNNFDFQYYNSTEEYSNENTIKNNSTFSIHPNPTTNEFIISINTIDDIQYDIEIKDVFGKTVKVKHNLGNNAHINISDLTSGVYFVIIKMKNNEIVKKIIKG